MRAGRRLGIYDPRDELIEDGRGPEPEFHGRPQRVPDGARDNSADDDTLTAVRSGRAQVVVEVEPCTTDQRTRTADSRR